MGSLRPLHHRVDHSAGGIFSGRRQWRHFSWEIWHGTRAPNLFRLSCKRLWDKAPSSLVTPAPSATGAPVGGLSCRWHLPSLQRRLSRTVMALTLMVAL